ncbi:cell division cycle protein 27 homolog isoform X1 [Macrosteles quadrilineatus]|uniref:cell division cycle protein 27 homolog isoform X1 n=1 Tax=Macrosteles quadrilineatus TaxID=74068 RepID=UPI0023E09BA0|nr:cell division cycle protein 27 homolog isoform X1 [Macrosteles quadrilineatus]
MIMEPVQAAIWHCLNNYSYGDAIFLAERLRAEVESDETLFLLATCYYRSGKPAQAYNILKDKGPVSAQCKYLLARCCLDLQKNAEAEAVLTGGDATRTRSLDEITAEFGNLSCFALSVIGRVCCASERTVRGVEAYKRALKLNPLLWQSYEQLCRHGEKPEPNKIFSMNHLDNLGHITGTQNPFVSTSPAEFGLENNLNIQTPIQIENILTSNKIECSGIRPFSPDDSPMLPLRSAKTSGFRKAFSGSSVSPLTPSFGVMPLVDWSPQDVYPSPLPVFFATNSTLTDANEQKTLAKRQLISRKETPLQQSKTTVFSQSCNTSHVLTTPSATPVPGPLNNTAQNVRRSSRLFTNSYSVKENNKSPNRNKFATPKSPSRKTKSSRLAKANLNKTNFQDLNERNRLGVVGERPESIVGDNSNSQMNCATMTQQYLGMQKQSIEGLLTLLREVGTAYLHLSQFQCRKAIECLSSLPSQQYNTGWVLGLLGRAYLELTDYQKAVHYFSQVREKEAHRMEGMELYSTALWHLQREAALSALAQDLISLDRHSPHAWCAAGNCFSLHKEHDTAIKFMHRAVQVDPNFAYAYTLLGHEYVVTEELEKAMSCYRNAVRIDSRHYIAWFGIGTIYSKQERFQLAEVHFKRALAINPHNSVVMCHIGVVQNAQQKTDQALQTLDAAIAADPSNPLCKFHRASIFFAVGRLKEALQELEELKEIVPSESLVYYLTGKVHKKLGNTHLALMHFSWATDLDPKGANSQIKDAIDPSISRSHTEDSDFVQVFPPAESSQEMNSLQLQDSDDSLL